MDDKNSHLDVKANFKLNYTNFMLIIETNILNIILGSDNQIETLFIIKSQVIFKTTYYFHTQLWTYQTRPIMFEKIKNEKYLIYLD